MTVVFALVMEMNVAKKRSDGLVPWVLLFP